MNTINLDTWFDLAEDADLDELALLAEEGGTNVD